MGNSGGSLVARSPESLAGVLEQSGFAGVDEVRALEGGWQMAEFAEASQECLGELVRATGAPAVVVSYFDGDVGFVAAETPAGAAWEALLNRDCAAGYEIPLEQFPVEAAVTGALEWAAAAGVTADEDAVREALLGEATFAEDLALRLITALGVPATGTG